MAAIASCAHMADRYVLRGRSDRRQASLRTSSGVSGSNRLTTIARSEIAMNPTPHDQTRHDEPAEEMPDVTMTDSGEKEPGEDPDFDDSELDVDDRG